MPEGKISVIIPAYHGGIYLSEAVAALRPRTVVYVACDPAALARDLATAREAGLELAELRVLDAFPMTHHVECLARLVPRGVDEQDPDRP